MSKVKNENYITIQGWMINDLNLKGNELLVYAIIYGFSQNEEQNYSGSLQYLADWTNSSKQTIITCLKSLIVKDLIEKNEKILNGVKFCEYHSKNLNRGSQKNLMGVVKKFEWGSQKIGHNNIEDNINNNNNNINTTTTNINYSNNNKELSSNSSNKDIFNFIEENIGRTLSPLEYQEICTWEDNDLTRYAIKEAVLNGKYTIGYIRGILHNYKQNNIISVQQAEMKKEEFQKKKSKPYETKQEREEREFQEMLDRVIGSDDDDQR